VQSLLLVIILLFIIKVTGELSEDNSRKTRAAAIFGNALDNTKVQ